MEMLMQMFSYPFIVRAFIVGILVSLCAALLGVSLVLKQYSMIGDGLSHVSYGIVNCDRMWHRTACTFNTGSDRSGLFPVAYDREWINEVGCSHRCHVSFGVSDRCIGNKPYDRNDYGCVQLHVWQHFGDDIRRRIFKRWFVCDRIVVIYLLLSQYLYGHFRRKLCQSNGG